MDNKQTATKLKKSWPFIFPFLIILLIGYNQFKESKASFQNKDVYEKQIIECKKKFKDVMNNQFNCIYKVTQEAYKINPERGVELCVKYNYMINLPGFGMLKGNMTENSKRAICRSQLFTAANETGGKIYDAHCESLLVDTSLTGVTAYGYPITAEFYRYCYFKKALETNNPAYCKEPTSESGYFLSCVEYFAMRDKKTELCSKYLVGYDKSSCIDEMKYYGNVLIFPSPCEYVDSASKSIQERCKQEFGNTFESLEVTVPPPVG